MLFANKNYQESPVFKPENLLREARRQKMIPQCDIPRVCVLDPDGDMVNYLVSSQKASLCKCWSCYHTKMYQFNLHGFKVGIIGNAVGASFAVLLAEQMFVSGCEILISITSAGIITPPAQGTRFILIAKALRDEGTSYHYLPPQAEATLGGDLLKKLRPLTNIPELAVAVGNSWTTDAPYRETGSAIERAKSMGANAVEMEAAALYAFATARGKQVICYAHLTNTMAQDGKDFEKGRENGSIDSLEVIRRTIACLNGF